MNNREAKAQENWKNDREFFFKYMSRDTGRIVLENRTLRWSTPGTLNDPYDVQFDLQFDIKRDVVKQTTLDKMWTLTMEINQLRSEIYTVY